MKVLVCFSECIGYRFLICTAFLYNFAARTNALDKLVIGLIFVNFFFEFDSPVKGISYAVLGLGQAFVKETVLLTEISFLQIQLLHHGIHIDKNGLRLDKCGVCC